MRQFKEGSTKGKEISGSKEYRYKDIGIRDHADESLGARERAGLKDEKSEARGEKVHGEKF